MDFAGPFTVKKGHIRKPVLVKAYLCIFVCFSTKSTHIEPVSNLSTEAFLAALKRFVSRHGLPTDLYSDNGSNFKGATNDLQDFYDFLSSSPLQQGLTSSLLMNRISWHFSPERSPLAVKSAKFHLKRVIGQQKLTFEEFATILCQV